MKTVLIVTAFCLVILAGCSSNDGSNGGAASKGSEDGSPASEAGDVSPQQNIPVCDWFAKLIEDVNAGRVRGTASGDQAEVGETMYRINNMYGMSLSAHESIQGAVNNLMAKARGKFEFEDVREQIDALRDACAQFEHSVPELQ
jgi:hypothetical protein